MNGDLIPPDNWLEYPPLDRSFYTGPDVVGIAQSLLGKVLISHFDQQICAARIVETEAYRAPDDQACHAANNRRTPRTETMFKEGGHAYVYLIYGLHHLFNVVTNQAESAHAVLIRALAPLSGISTMLERRGFSTIKTQLTAGPGVLSKAMGIHIEHDGMDLCAKESPIKIVADGVRITPKDIQTGTRVGVGYAGKDALRPWRFSIRDHAWVSKAKGSVYPTNY